MRGRKKEGSGTEGRCATITAFSEADKSEAEKALLRPNLFGFNVILIVAVIIIMFASGLPTFCVLWQRQHWAGCELSRCETTE